MSESNREASSIHVSVMPAEVTEWIAACHPATVIDGTYGGGGHSRRLLQVVPTDGLVIGIDRDPQVLSRVESEDHDERLTVFLGSYEKAERAMEHCGVKAVDALLLDLGLSSDQLADRDRGFSFNEDGPLDLRFDPESGTPASRWLAQRTEKEIADTIYQFGEERYSRRIAKAIIERARARSPVQTVDQLVQICRRCVPRAKNHDIHPATRTFQALRIAVNDELEILTRTLAQAPNWIAPGGRIAVISFHSLEDRITKCAFRDDHRWNVLTRRPLVPTEDEVRQNPRSRSAKLRVAERAKE